MPGGYWLSPARMAATAASSTSGGPSVSGKPCPRLIEPVATASADISAKIVVPKPCSRLVRYGTSSLTTRSVRRSSDVDHPPEAEIAHHVAHAGRHLRELVGEEDHAEHRE